MLFRRIMSIGPDRLYAAFVVAGLLVMCLHWWRPGYNLSAGDSSYPQAPLNQLLMTFSAWNHSPSVLGTVSGGAANAPFLLAVLALKSMFGDSLGQIIMLWLLQAGAWLGMQAFLRQLQASPLGAAIGATGYVLNPWSLQFIGYNYPIEILEVLLPFIGLLLLRYEPQRGRVLSLAFVLLAAIPFAPIGLNPAYLLLTLLALSSLIGLAFVLSAHRREFAWWTLKTFGLCLIAAAWWLIPIGWQYLDTIQTAVLSPGVWSWVIARSSILNNLRLNPIWWWRPGFLPYSERIDSNLFLYATQFVSIAALCLALALSTGVQRLVVRYSALVTAGAILISKGLHAPAAWFNELLYAVPGMFLFREPTTKAPLIALIFASVGLAVCFDALAARLRSFHGADRWNPGLRGALAGTVLILVVCSTYPAVTGELAHDATDLTPSNYARIPAYWRDAISHLNAQPPGGVLLLPPDTYYQVNYGWYYGSDGITASHLNKPPDRLLNEGAYSISAQRFTLNTKLRSAIYSGSPLVGRMLGDLGTGYVVFRGDVFTDPRALVSLVALRAELGGVPARLFGPLAVFSLPHRPRVTASTDWIEQTGRDLAAGDELELRALEEKTARLDASARTSLGSPALVEAIDASLSADRLISAHSPLAGRLRGPTVRLVASFLGSDVEERSVTARRLQRITWRGARDCIEVFYALHDLRTDQRSYRVFNPSFSPVDAAFAILVLPIADRVYTMNLGGRKVSRRVAANRFPVWLEFRSMVIPPGESSLVLESEAGRGGEQLPPYNRGEALGEARMSTPQTFVPLPPPRSANLAFDPEHPLVSLGVLPLNLTLADDPQVSISASVDASAPVKYGVTWLVDVHGARYAVYQRINETRAPVSAVDAIEQTLARAGVKVTADDFGRIRILGAEVVVSSWEWESKGKIEFSSVRVGWSEGGPARIGAAGLVPVASVDGTHIRTRAIAGSVLQRDIPVRASGRVAASIERNARSLSVAAIGRSPLNTTDAGTGVALEQEGLLVVHIPSGKPRLITLTDQYDPGWIGIAWQGLRPVLLRHLVVDRWRNGFVAPPASAVTVFFLAVPVQYVCLFVTATLIVVLALRARRAV